jgi:hypothetical protein
MKPGDLIEWVDLRSGVVVPDHEGIWSTPMQRYVPVGGIALLISITPENYTYLSNRGLFTTGAAGTIVLQVVR